MNADFLKKRAMLAWISTLGLFFSLFQNCSGTFKFSNRLSSVSAGSTIGAPLTSSTAMFSKIYDASLLSGPGSFNSNGFSLGNVSAPGSLILSNDQKTIYGVDLYGSSIFSCLVGASECVVLNDFSEINSNGVEIYGNSISLSPDGTTLYGLTTQNGTGQDHGMVFSCSLTTSIPCSNINMIHHFTGPSNDGGSPTSNGLVISSDGSTIYGLTYYGGTKFGGTLFKCSATTASPSCEIIFNFDPAIVYGPLGHLVLSKDGTTLFGITQYAYNKTTNSIQGPGTIFSFPTNGNVNSTLSI